MVWGHFISNLIVIIVVMLFHVKLDGADCQRSCFHAFPWIPAILNNTLVHKISIFSITFTCLSWLFRSFGIDPSVLNISSMRVCHIVPVRGPLNESNRYFGKLFVLDRYTWYHITVCKKLLVWFGLVCWFYGISTFVGYLTPNPFLCK